MDEAFDRLNRSYNLRDQWLSARATRRVDCDLTPEEGKTSAPPKSVYTAGGLRTLETVPRDCLA